MKGGVRVRAPAKVNLYLRVLAREASGYHGVETLFQAVALHDRIRVRRREEPGVGLQVEGGVDTGPDDRNLALRAARAYRSRAGLEAEPGVEILLEKTIPAGAGLGGGSSDAAAVLRALDELHGGALSGEELLEVGAELGSDVPFFLGPGTLALGWGRGERLLELPPLPERPMVVVIPAFRISTAEAYRELARRREGSRRPAGARPRILERYDLASWESVARRAANDFQDQVFEERPRAAEIRAALADAGASPALLSGSGSALFGVYAGEEEADAAAERVRGAFPEAAVVRTRTLAAFGRTHRAVEERADDSSPTAGP